ncbi:MAG: ATP-binding cassette domain-containing protein [Bacillota bacterium]
MEYVIKTEHLSRRFGKVEAVKDLNLRVPQGSVYGFLGPNGAGKTTTIRMLLGLTKPSSGSIQVLGQPADSGKHLARIGFLPDVPNFYNWMRGEEFLLFMGSLFSIPYRDLRKRVAELLALTGLQGVKTKVGGYSRGMKQRLGLAQALLNNPELIFLDEPTSALDPIGRKEVLETIKVMSDKCTVFFSTHILSDVERVCNRVGILRSGQLVADETIEELQRRYGQKALKLQVIGEAEPFVAALEAAPWSQVLKRENGSILVAASDLAAAQREIPRLLVQHNLGLGKLEPVEVNLEDIFVRLVNSHEK